ncbi:extracellular solute-binding protein [Allokutzneria albata]|uniref:extracellular solute-binding protein n=1 Tax=Allokutzneria albata TaxID=211114 RepID=UPI0018D3A12B|nr:extracellular solute-binding protein [Allokutzneria albata]
MTLGACAPGSGSVGDRPADRPAGEVRTDPATMGKVTLTVWDQEVRGGQEKQITALNDAFQRKYPNITIKRVARSFDDLRSTVKLGLTGAEAPDVVQVNNGKQDMGSFVKAGLLQPLDGYATAHKWTQRMPESVLRLAKYPDSGAVLGEGKLYGVPQTGELVGLFYNKEKLTKLGIQPPKTWEDFDAALAAAKRAGELPIQFGNLEKSSGSYLFSLAMHRYGKAEEETRLATGRDGVSWNTEANKQAARLLLSWADNGYFPQGYAGIKSDDSWAAFARGEGLFHVSGTWLTADIQAAMGDKVGFQLPPGQTVTGGTGLPFAVSARSKNPDAAAAYIDFITNADAMKVLADNGNLPATEADKQAATGLTKDVFTAWQTASRSTQLVPYLDYATVTAYDTVTGAIEQLLAKRHTVDQFLTVLQDDLDKGRGGR